MATDRFSTLSDGQSISGFRPGTDVLNFDQTVIAAADIRAVAEGAHLRISVASGTHAGKDILLLNVTPLQLTTGNVTFANGSRLIFGDNSTGQSGDNGNNSLTGTSGRDHLSGFGGNDTLNGGAGADLMVGGLHDDLYFVDNPGDVVVELEGGGSNDEVRSTVSYTLSDWVNNLTLTGSAAIDGTGNELGNVITGNAAANRLSGAGGNDTLSGGAGNDTAVYAAAGSHYTVLRTSGGTLAVGHRNAGAEGVDRLTGIEQLQFADGAMAASQASSVQRYTASYADLIQAFGTNEDAALNHYLANGYAEGRTVSFDGLRYIASYGDLIQAYGTNAAAGVEHYLNYGYGEGRTVSFDGLRYIASYGDLIQAYDTNAAAGVEHYVNFGFAEGRTVSFDGLRYIASYGDLIDSLGANAAAGTVHFIDHGFSEGRSTTFNAAQYLANYSDLQAAFGNDLQAATAHYIVYGHDEGRTDQPGADLRGTEGDDSLTGTPGNDTIDGLGGNDTINGLGGNDSLIGGEGNDSLIGGEGNDSMMGGDGNDTLVGTGGADTMDGGLGDDTYFARYFDILTDAGGIDTVIATSYRLGTGLENLILRDNFPSTDVVGVGNNLNNLIRSEGTASAHLDGGDGDDTLIGGDTSDSFTVFEGTGNVGNDVVEGGGGYDFLSVGAFSGVLVNLATGSVSGGGTGGSGSIAFVNIEEVAGGGFNDTLIGSAGDDHFTFFSAYGTDSVDGGAGVDTLFVASADDGVVVDLGAGTLTGGGAGSNATLVSIENFAGTMADDRITGSSAANVLSGNYGNDTLDGGAGNDTLYGGGRTDPDSFALDHFVFSVAPGVANADVVAEFTTGKDKIILAASAHANAGAAGNFAAGDGRFWAAAGANSGHDADDRVVYDTINGQLWYDADGNGSEAAQLIATLQSFSGTPALSATDIAIDVAGVHITGTNGNDSLVGGFGQDTLEGLAGNDTLDGGAGADRMEGGPNDDVFVVDDDGDVLVELEGGGIDLVLSSAHAYSLPAWVDNLTLTGTARQGLGNELDNVLAGNAAANWLHGGGGNDSVDGAGGDDTLFGGGGNDSVNGGDGNDFLDGSEGNDTVIGGAGNDVFYFQILAGTTYGDDVIDGGQGADWLNFSGPLGSGVVVNLAEGSVSGGGESGVGSVTFAGIEHVFGSWRSDRITGDSGNNSLHGGEGSEGADTLDGGAGNDWLTGGLGADSFDFTTAPGATNADQITDFVSGTDKLRLDDAAHAGIGPAGNFAAGDARFAAGAGFTSGRDADDRVIYDTTTGNLYYDADGSDPGAAQLIATLQGNPVIAATDIAVI